MNNTPEESCLYHRPAGPDREQTRSPPRQWTELLVGDIKSSVFYIKTQVAAAVIIIISLHSDLFRQEETGYLSQNRFFLSFESICRVT